MENKNWKKITIPILLITKDRIVKYMARHSMVQFSEAGRALLNDALDADEMKKETEVQK